MFRNILQPLKWWVFPQEIHKARLWVDEDGELHGLSFANQQIPMDLLDALNKAMHEVVDRFNGKTSWKENYVKFTDNGKRYEQFDGKMKKNWI